MKRSDNNSQSDEQNSFLKDFDISEISLNSNKVILKHLAWWEKLKQLPNGTNIYQASKVLGIPYTSLNEFLRELEFCQLIKLYTSIENGRAVKIIEIPKLSEVKNGN